MIRILLSTGSVLAVVGCSAVGPNYQQPSLNLASTFVLGGSDSLSESSHDSWWQRLNDPLLNELVVRGSDQNLDVLSAIERISAASALLKQTGLNSQTSGGISAESGRRSVGGSAESMDGVGINGAYVFDLFGGFARGKERSIANYEAAQFDVGTTRLAFLADLTNGYLQARYYQEAAAITRQSIASRKRTLAIVNQRRDVGEATELEVQQARSLLASARAPLPVMVANFEVNVYRIATLLAEPASPLLERMQSGARQPRPTGFTSTGLPADLLRNRPDVRAAERQLAAATAQIGVAEAQLYPSVQLSGTLGAGTVDQWAFGPLLTIPVLNRGFLRGQKLAAESAARSSELAWRESVLTAVEEVQVAVTLCRNWNRQIQHLRRATASSRAVLQLSRESYSLGEATLADVLDAERTNANNRLALADAIRSYSLSWMRVQIATGRGWYVDSMTSAAEVRAPDLTPDPLGTSELVVATDDGN